MRRTLVLLVLALCWTGCGDETQREPVRATRAKPLVYATSYPLAYFAERIGGDLVEVVCPVPPGEDPATWMPDAKTIAAYQRADLILVNGAGYEQWLDKVSLPKERVFDTTAHLEALIKIENATTHSHGGKTHTHEGVNPHTWLDFTSASSQADAVRARMATLTPAEHASALESRSVELREDLLALYDRLSLMPHVRVWASHPSYDYLARAHRWTLHNAHIDPDADPDDVPWDALRQRIERHPATHMLWEREPREELAARIDEELGLEGIVVSTCETKPDGEETYLTVMTANVGRLLNALPLAELPEEVVDDGLDDARTVEQLLAVLTSGNEDEREDAVRVLALRLDAAALERDGAKLIAPLTAALGDASADVTAGAASILARMGTTAAPAVAPLTKALERDDPMVRARVATALQEIGPAAGSATSALVALLNDATEVVRINAAGALIKIDPDPAVALTPLTTSLRGDESDEVRIHAALALGELGASGGPAVGALEAALTDDQSEVRAAAAWALGNIGAPARGTVDALKELLKDELFEVRSAARRALDRLEK